ncbi:thiamin pyrophosphokinase 1 isoform X2 [Galleria mellonella]|uniref:Thiamin pyrophosphokinase 1 isoform X2 n=1 Tax=Galleria mellonella TaxID=7137 RepID=A0ABM3MD01_GALME|nr:thiamin pyrophosphokinase 1 isoform X2 [Galleria mellonella]
MAINGGINNMVKKLSNILYMQHNYCGQSCSVVKCWQWNIKRFIMFQTNKTIQDKYAVLILNRPISQNPDFVKSFWNNASVRMAVDGGTARWDTFLNQLPEDVQKTMKLPDFVTGDFDSLTEDVLNKYKKKGTKTIRTPDQNNTDFTKALMELNKHCQQENLQLDHVIAVCQNSGRLDHILANIQTLHLVKVDNLLNPNTTVYILSDDSISWLLSPGDHVISVPEETRQHRRAWCSLVPIGTPCESVTTSGLKWNLDNQELKFGELVSTSNTFDGSEFVKIKCSHVILWSMRVPHLISK